MSVERVKIEQVVSVAAEDSGVFRKIPRDRRQVYEARIVDILAIAESLCNGLWNNLRFYDILDHLEENPGSDGRNRYYAIAQDIADNGYARVNGANTAVEKVTMTSMRMLSYGVTSLEDLNKRQHGLAPGELPPFIKE